MARDDRRRVTVPWFVTVAAVAVPLCVLPSAVWRLGLVIEVLRSGVGPCGREMSYGETLYVAALSVVTMTAAWLTVGLVRPWGEIFPRWLPFMSGREVPVGAVTAAATTGATLVALLIAYAFLGMWGLRPVPEIPPQCLPAEVAVYYIPLIAWAPLLYFVTYHYYKRRTTRRDAAEGSTNRESHATVAR